MTAPAEKSGRAKRSFAVFYVSLLAAALLCLALTMPPLRDSGYAERDGAPYFEDTPDLVDLNTAPAAELRCLPGIGEKRAQAIVEYRAQNGTFASVEDLAAVKGISAKIIDGLRAYVILS